MNTTLKPSLPRPSILNAYHSKPLHKLRSFHTQPY